MICLPSPVVLRYRLIKQRNELLGHPVQIRYFLVWKDSEEGTSSISFLTPFSFQQTTQTIVRQVNDFCLFKFPHYIPCRRLSLLTNQIAAIVSERGVLKNQQLESRLTFTRNPNSHNWSHETMTCYSFNCFRIVWGQGQAPLVTSLPRSSCYMTHVGR